MVARLLVNRVDGTVQDASAVAPVFDTDGTPLLKMGMRYSDGEPSQGTALLIDDSGLQLNGTLSLPGHALLTMIEDVTGCPYWLHRGRRSDWNARRGARKAGNSTDIGLTSADCNVELRNPHFTEDWVRPEETDYARVVALQGYQFNGTDSTAPHHRDSCRITVHTSHRAPNTNTVLMPAKTYEIGSTAEDVIRDCAETAGKTYSVTIHHGGVSGSGPGDAGRAFTNHTLDVADPGPNHLKITLTRDVAAGMSLLAILATHGGSASGFSASDPSGNTWTLIHTALGTSNAPEIHVVRCDVATDLSAGDVVNFAWTSDPDTRLGQIYAFASLGTLDSTADATAAVGTTPAVAFTSSAGNLSVVCAGNEWGGGATGLQGYVPDSGDGVRPYISGGGADWTTWGLEPFIDADAFGSGLEIGQFSNAALTGWTGHIHNADGTSRARDWTATALVFSTGDGAETSTAGIADDVDNCSHLCLQYIDPLDTVTNVSTLKISDQYADWDPDNLTDPVLEPIWDMGDVEVDTTEMISAIVSRYGVETSASVYVEDTTASDANDFWTDVFDDSESVNATQAGWRASAIVSNRKWGHPTVPLTIIIRDDQAHLFGAGSLVQIKSAIAAGGTYLGTYVNRRVAEAIFEPLTPEKMVRLTGTPTYGYKVRLSLDRPPKRSRTRKGKLRHPGDDAAERDRDAV